MGAAPMALPVVTEPAKDSVAQRGRIYTPLPRTWIGFALAVVCFLFQVSGLDTWVVITSFAGSCYWLFCVYRIHKILAEYSVSSYKISPRKALGFQFIPIYLYFWTFKWTRQIAQFARAESAGAQKISDIWPGILLVAASIGGLFEEFKTIRLIIIFSVGLYLTRKLKKVLPASRPLRFRRSQQWKLSISAGIGAAFSFVLFQAIQHFRFEKLEEKLHELVAIVLVSVGMIIFLEPVFEKIRGALGHEEHHAVPQKHKPLHIRLAVVTILVVTSLFHGLLHAEIDFAVKNDLLKTIGMLLASSLLAGGITYFWINASHQRPPHAARTGLLSGAILGFLLAFTIFVSDAMPDGSAKRKVSEEAATASVQQALQVVCPWVPQRIEKEVTEGKGSALGQMAVVTAPWALLGLLGGLAIDKRWRSGRSSSVAMSIMAAGLVSGIVLRLSNEITTMSEMLWHFSAVIGWALAVYVCSSSEVLMPDEEHLFNVHSEPKIPLGGP
jgi:hypothetical protein